ELVHHGGPGGVEPDEPGGGQLPERVPDRTGADAELLGDAGLDEPRPAGDGPRHDAPVQDRPYRVPGGWTAPGRARAICPGRPVAGGPAHAGLPPGASPNRGASELTRRPAREAGPAAGARITSAR